MDNFLVLRKMNDLSRHIVKSIRIFSNHKLRLREIAEMSIVAYRIYDILSCFDCLTQFKDWNFLRNIQKMHFPPENGWIEKLMIPSESAPPELSNEWSCQYVSAISVSHPLTEVTISP
jgi:hypothetical protein